MSICPMVIFYCAWIFVWAVFQAAGATGPTGMAGFTVTFGSGQVQTTLTECVLYPGGGGLEAAVKSSTLLENIGIYLPTSVQITALAAAMTIASPGVTVFRLYKDADEIGLVEIPNGSWQFKLLLPSSVTVSADSRLIATVLGNQNPCLYSLVVIGNLL